MAQFAPKDSHMSDPVTPTPILDGMFGFAPAAPRTDESDEIAPAPAADPAPTPDPVAVKDPEPAPEATRLADLIRRDREERAARAQESKRQADLEGQLAEAHKELERVKRAPSFEDDPVGYVKAKKLSPEAQLMLGQSLLYDLAPDKAPPDLRFKLFEARQTRAEQVKEAQRQEAEAKAAAEMQHRILKDFAESLETAARSFNPGTFPESEAWFGEDHSTYTRSMMATAQNLSESARKAGRVADLSPSAVAAVLEAEVVARMKARDARKAGKAPLEKAVAPKGAGGVQATGDTTSTKGLGAGGTPAPKATTDEERLARAVKVAFRAPR